MSSDISQSRIPDILARLSAHLDKLAAQVFDVEEALGDLISTGGTTDKPSVTKLQSLDFVRQSLEDCALLAHQLGAQPILSSEEGAALEVLRAKLKLAATQELVSPEKNDPKRHLVSGNGDLDLF